MILGFDEHEDNKIKDLIFDLKSLEQRFLKEGRSYLKLANVPEGSKPDDSPPEVRGLVYSSGTYQLCAKGIRDLLKKHNLWN